MIPQDVGQVVGPEWGLEGAVVLALLDVALLGHPPRPGGYRRHRRGRADHAGDAEAFEHPGQLGVGEAG
ncbi:MAG: hypothetical protein ACR2G7_13505 [Acidimicrobiales bacterium]